MRSCALPLCRAWPVLPRSPPHAIVKTPASKRIKLDATSPSPPRLSVLLVNPSLRTPFLQNVIAAVFPPSDIYNSCGKIRRERPECLIEPRPRSLTLPAHQQLLIFTLNAVDGSVKLGPAQGGAGPSRYLAAASLSSRSASSRACLVVVTVPSSWASCMTSSSCTAARPPRLAEPGHAR